MKKRYIQPETEIIAGTILPLLAGSLDPGEYTDPDDDYQGGKQVVFFDEEEEDENPVPLFTVKHKNLWE